MNQQSPPKNSFARKVARWIRRQRAASQKRRAEYLHLGGDKRLRRLMINLHPESLFSFFTSWDGMWFVFRIVVTAILFLSLLVTFAYFYYRGEAPATVLDLQSCAEGRISKFYDRTGQTLLWELKEGTDCQPVQLDDISTYLIDGVISMEDKDFFNHPGYKVTSIARSVVNNLLGKPRQGGSTITQQYIKNAVLKDTDRSYERKIKEMVLVPEIESKYSKRAILTAYLNTVNFGNAYGGIEAAAQGYFDKPAAKLTLDESALIVASMTAPNVYWNEPEVHLSRRDLVLSVMLADGKISQAEHDRALEVDTLAKVRRSDSAQVVSDTPAPHFILYARQQADQLICQSDSECLNLQSGGYKIITTLDLTTQQQMEEAIETSMTALKPAGYDNAALAVIDSGRKEVVALTGSRGFDHPNLGQFDNMAALRPPEDTWHPLLYAALLENSSDWGAGSIFYDYEALGWQQDEPFLGPVSFRRALAESITVPTAKAAYLSGEEKITQLADELGLMAPSACEIGCAIQQATGRDFTIRLAELANLYATLADDGLYQDLGYVRQITNSRGVTIYERDIDSYTLLDQQTTFIINDILSDAAFKPADLRRFDKLAFKGSTGGNPREKPFFAYTPAVVLAGWIGQQGPNSAEPPDSSEAATHQALLTANFFELYSGSTGQSWPRPNGLKILSTNAISGRAGSGPTDYYRSTYKPDTKPAVVRIDRVTGRLAGECTPEEALSERTTLALKPELPPGDPAYDAWLRPIWTHLGPQLDGSIPSQIDNLHDCDDQPPQLDVDKSGNCQQSCRLTIKATAGTHDLQSIIIKANREGVQDVTKPVNGRSATVNYTYDGQQTDARSLRVEVVDKALYRNSSLLSL